MKEDDVKVLLKNIAAGAKARGEPPVFEHHFPSKPKVVLSEKAPREMNGVEIKYASHLEGLLKNGDILWWEFEPMKLRLAANTTITMDFAVMYRDKRMEFHDSKAYWRGVKGPGVKEDAQIKMKVAADKFWMFTFKVVWFHEGRWHERMY